VHLESLSLFDFKNYAEARFDFKSKISCFLGNNGVGKTNLLDAIHYLSLTKSVLGNADAQSVSHGKGQFILQGIFKINAVIAQVTCAYQLGSKKTIKVDGHEPDKLSDHIGKYPVVMVAPNDIELVWGGSELRRKFFDSMIAQVDRQYLENLIQYNYNLKQRNGLLRLFGEGTVDYDLLEAYNQKLVLSGNYIYQKRKSFLEEFLPLFAAHYQYLSGENGEASNIAYRTDCEGQDFAQILQNSLRKDLVLQRTSVGIHRDDFLFQLAGYDLKREGSQGQQKSFLIGLKLAEFQCIEAHREVKPLLLLDDIFDKLDDERIDKLVNRVADGAFGQIFITDARPDRSDGLLQNALLEAELFHIKEGKLITAE